MTNKEHLANLIDLNLIGEINDSLFIELAEDINTGLNKKQIKDIHQECKLKTSQIYGASNLYFITKIVSKKLK